MSKKCEKLSKKIEITESRNEIEYLARIAVIFTNNRLNKPIKYKNKDIIVSNGALKHLTTEGSKIPSEREVALERCCRINWIFDILHDNICIGCNKFWIWSIYHDGKKKIKIYCVAEDYLIILEEKKDICILLSAYKVWAHEARKLKQEYKRSFKST